MTFTTCSFQYHLYTHAISSYQMKQRPLRSLYSIKSVYDPDVFAYMYQCAQSRCRPDSLALVAADGLKHFAE